MNPRVSVSFVIAVVAAATSLYAGSMTSAPDQQCPHTCEAIGAIDASASQNGCGTVVITPQDAQNGDANKDGTVCSTCHNCKQLVNYSITSGSCTGVCTYGHDLYVYDTSGSLTQTGTTSTGMPPIASNSRVQLETNCGGTPSKVVVTILSGTSVTSRTFKLTCGC